MRGKPKRYPSEGIKKAAAFILFAFIFQLIPAPLGFGYMMPPSTTETATSPVAEVSSEETPTPAPSSSSVQQEFPQLHEDNTLTPATIENSPSPGPSASASASAAPSPSPSPSASASASPSPVRYSLEELKTKFLEREQIVSAEVSYAGVFSEEVVASFTNGEITFRNVDRDTYQLRNVYYGPDENGFPTYYRASAVYIIRDETPPSYELKNDDGLTTRAIEVTWDKNKIVLLTETDANQNEWLEFGEKVKVIPCYARGEGLAQTYFNESIGCGAPFDTMYTADYGIDCIDITDEGTNTNACYPKKLVSQSIYDDNGNLISITSRYEVITPTPNPSASASTSPSPSPTGSPSAGASGDPGNQGTPGPVGSNPSPTPTGYPSPTPSASASSPSPSPSPNPSPSGSAAPAQPVETYDSEGKLVKRVTELEGGGQKIEEFFEDSTEPTLIVITNQDGKITELYYNMDEDGNWERYGLDGDGDGNTEESYENRIWTFDNNDDGIADYWREDTDGDGDADRHSYDRNKNGQPDDEWSDSNLAYSETDPSSSEPSPSPSASASASPSPSPSPSASASTSASPSPSPSASASVSASPSPSPSASASVSASPSPSPSASASAGALGPTGDPGTSGPTGSPSPTASENDFFRIDEGSGIKIPVSVLLQNDTSGDPAALSFNGIVPGSEPVHGTLTKTGDVFYYAATDPLFSGTDYFNYSFISQDQVLSARVTIEIMPVNDPPVASGREIAKDLGSVIDSGDVFQINLLEDIADNGLPYITDKDLPGDFLDITLVSDTGSSTYETEVAKAVLINGIVTVTPKSAGFFLLQYHVRDGSGAEPEPLIADPFIKISFTSTVPSPAPTVSPSPSGSANPEPGASGDPGDPGTPGPAGSSAPIAAAPAPVVTINGDTRTTVTVTTENTWSPGGLPKDQATHITDITVTTTLVEKLIEGVWKQDSREVKTHREETYIGEPVGSSGERWKTGRVTKDETIRLDDENYEISLDRTTVSKFNIWGAVIYYPLLPPALPVIKPGPFLHWDEDSTVIEHQEEDFGKWTSTFKGKQTTNFYGFKTGLLQEQTIKDTADDIDFKYMDTDNDGVFDTCTSHRLPVPCPAGDSGAAGPTGDPGTAGPAGLPAPVPAMETVSSLPPVPNAESSAEMTAYAAALKKQYDEMQAELKTELAAVSNEIAQENKLHKSEAASLKAEIKSLQTSVNQKKAKLSKIKNAQTKREKQSEIDALQNEIQALKQMAAEINLAHAQQAKELKTKHKAVQDEQANLKALYKENNKTAQDKIKEFRRKKK